MEITEKIEKVLDKDYRNTVHYVLAHSYSFYFILLLVSFFLDLVFPIQIFENSTMAPIGFWILIFATVLIFWAQKTGWDLRKIKEKKAEHFCRGPYCYSRIPTQWGLFFLILGFGVTTNSFFVILSTIISLLVFKFVFMKTHDRILVEKYGAPYLEYKKIVKF